MLDVVFVCIFAVGLTGAALDLGMRRLERRLVHWPQPGAAAFAGAGPASGNRLSGSAWPSLALPLTLLAVWQLAAAGGGHAQILVAPLTVLHTLTAGVLDGSLAGALAVSLGRSLAGLAIGGGAGVLLGLALGLWRPAERAFGPFLAAVRQVAIFAWVPLLTAWFGLGEPAKVAFVALAAFFPLLMATHAGVAGVSPQLTEAAAALRLSLAQRLRLLILPGAAPAIFSGLRLGLIYAWLGTVGAEYFMPSGGGIGSALIGAQQLFRMDLVIAAMVLIGLLGAALGALGQRLEHRATHWRHA
jgi:sulfonate transport system permease protein